MRETNAARQRTASVPATIAMLPPDADTALRIVLRLTEKLTEDLPLEDFLAAVATAAQELVPADHASIRLLDAAREQLLSSARAGAGSDFAPQGFKKSDGVLGWVIEQKRPAMIGNVADDARFKRFDAQPFAIRSMIAEPIWAAEEVIGVLSVASDRIDGFDDRDQLLVRLLANCSAPAIERARLRRLAMFDHLTMAFNHRYLYPRIAEEMERSSRNGTKLSVLLFDLDHFKSVNDMHGHSVGDLALRRLTERVRTAVRKIDVLVRRGGEEFVLIMPSTDEIQGMATAERLREHFATEPLQISDALQLRQTISIGVATWDCAETPEALEARADRAMYDAKRAGRDRVVFSTKPPGQPHESRSSRRPPGA